MKPGDLIKYEDVDFGFAVGLCLRVEENECEIGNPERMLVMWFDDWQRTYEPLDGCEEEYLEVISESR